MDRSHALDDRERARLVALRRQLHRRPELGFEEHETAALIEEFLRGLGLAPERIGGTGVVATIDGGRPGRTVLLRADIDALPIHEQNDHDYVSEIPGRMHACGHDGHTSILLFAAIKLLEQRAALPGRVVLCFQPAEEARGGAPRLIEEGVLDRFGVDRCAGLHLWSEFRTGEVAITDGPFMASSDVFEVTVHGKGGHGALPQAARDPLVAAARMIVAVQDIVSCDIAPEAAAVLSIGRIQGGDAPNVIPDTVSFGGTARAFSRDVQRALESAFRRKVMAAAEAGRVEADIAWDEVAIPVVNDPTCCAIAREVVRDHPGLDGSLSGFRCMASEDFSYFLDERPGLFLFLGAGNREIGAAYPHHHPRFDIDEAALPLGVELMAGLATALARP